MRSIESNGVWDDCDDSGDDNVGRGRMRGPAARAEIQRCEITAPSRSVIISGDVTWTEGVLGVCFIQESHPIIYTRALCIGAVADASSCFAIYKRFALLIRFRVP